MIYVTLTLRLKINKVFYFDFCVLLGEHKELTRSPHPPPPPPPAVVLGLPQLCDSCNDGLLRHLKAH
jgi:hypothetical protein